MHPPDESMEDAKDRFWSHVDRTSVLRLQELDHQIESACATLRRQLDQLIAFLDQDAGATDAEALSERGLSRLLLILEHSSHLARQSLSLMDERHQLLRW